MGKFLYQDVKDYLEGIALKHKNDSEFLLPSETQLMMKFSASRITVRRAMEELAEANVIRKVHGRGSYPAFSESERANLKTDTAVALIQPYPVTKLTVDITSGAVSYCYANGLKLISFFSLGNKEWESRAILTALDLRCAGIILMPLEKQNYSDAILQLSLQKTPTVFVDRKLYGLDLPYVASDHYAIAYDAVNYFADRGHQEICFLSALTPSSVQERMNGYEDALFRRFGHIKKHTLLVDYDPQTVYDIIYRYFAAAPEITAILSASGEIATVLLRVMRELGRKAQLDFEIMFVDEESHAIGDILDTDIPYIAQDGYSIGYHAAEIIHHWIETGTPDRQSVMVPTTTVFHRDRPIEIVASAPIASPVRSSEPSAASRDVERKPQAK